MDNSRSMANNTANPSSEPILSPLLALPLEIRLLIYIFLLPLPPHHTFEIRSMDPSIYLSSTTSPSAQPYTRTTYRILSPGLLRRSLQTTYCLTTLDATHPLPSYATRPCPAPGAASSSAAYDLHPQVFLLNRQIYEEASEHLYAHATFSFDTDIGSIIPFLSDLTPQTRDLITSISLTKSPAVYARDFDRAEWAGTCAYISAHLPALSKLDLTVVGGKPALVGSESFIISDHYTSADFKTLLSVGYEGVSWVSDLLMLGNFEYVKGKEGRTTPRKVLKRREGEGGLRELVVRLREEHCPPPRSEAMRFFAAFGQCVETGFAEFLREEMLGISTPDVETLAGEDV